MNNNTLPAFSSTAQRRSHREASPCLLLQPTTFAGFRAVEEAIRRKLDEGTGTCLLLVRPGRTAQGARCSFNRLDWAPAIRSSRSSFTWLSVQGSYLSSTLAITNIQLPTVWTAWKMHHHLVLHSIGLFPLCSCLTSPISSPICNI